jgi:thiamine-monophosphate kinase
VPIGEFELIERYFARGPQRPDVLLGVGDDAALLKLPPDTALVAATDTLVEGRHFLAGTSPRAIGHQCLAVNLSDLAAMGAEPAWALLSLSLPEAAPDWLEGFADGFMTLAARYGVSLVGGDTVRGPLVIGVTALGHVTHGLALKRSGAQPGDQLYVSGWPGEAAAGLELLTAAAQTEVADPLVQRFLYARPRIELGRVLGGRASSAMDVSDGLLGDLAKLCQASGVAAEVDMDSLPISAELAGRYTREHCERLVLGGGDDYELLFTLPAERTSKRELAALEACCRVTRIGQIVPGTGVRCLRRGAEVMAPAVGYDHFA